MQLMNDEQLKTYIQVYGGRETGSVSKKTNYLIMGADPGKTKQNAAREKGVPIISEEEFYKIVIDRSKKLGVEPQMCTYEESIIPLPNEGSSDFVDTTAKCE